eukprot:g2497.t1
MARKVAMVFISIVFTGDEDVYRQAAFAMALSAYLLYIHVVVRPFEDGQLDRMERWSLIVCFSTLWLGSMFFYNSRDAKSGESIVWLSIAIFLVNILYLLFFAITLCIRIRKEYGDKIVSKAFQTGQILKKAQHRVTHSLHLGSSSSTRSVTFRQQSDAALAIEMQTNPIKDLIHEEGLGNVEICTNQRGVTVFLVGTAHVSKKSAKLARKIVESISPDFLLLELCSERAMLLAEPNLDKKPTGNKSLLQCILRARQNGDSLFQEVFSFVQGEIASAVGCSVGEEFRQAASAARATPSPTVIQLMDRRVSRTIQRLWQPLSYFRRAITLGGLIFAMLSGFSQDDLKEIENLLASDEFDLVHTMVEEFSFYFPQISRILVDERNEYMTWAAQNVGRQKGERAICVVGAAHVSGMKECLERRIVTVPRPLSSTDYSIVKKTHKFLEVRLNSSTKRVMVEALIFQFSNGYLPPADAEAEVSVYSEKQGSFETLQRRSPLMRVGGQQQQQPLFVCSSRSTFADATIIRARFWSSTIANLFANVTDVKVLASEIGDGRINPRDHLQLPRRENTWLKIGLAGAVACGGLFYVLHRSSRD